MAKPPSDRDQVAQLVLDLEALQPYYHVDEVPDRRPLTILAAGPLRDRPPLSKFGEPVRYVEEPGDAPYFEFTKLDVDGGSADVEFRYPVEGIAGQVHLSQDDDAWKVVSHSLTER